LDASHIPLGYEARVTRDRAPTHRVHSLHSLTLIGRLVTLADHYRGLTLDGEGRPTIGIGAADPRVEVLTDGLLTEDGSLEFHYPTKNFADDGDVPITSYEEAQLIIAEAAARSGDTAQARVVINDLRATEALPAFTAAVATVDEMVDLVIEERRRWLFLEGGARLNDIIRLRGTAHNIPFLGEPGSIHPNGVTATGVRYGDDICLPLALEDRPGN